MEFASDNDLCNQIEDYRLHNLHKRIDLGTHVYIKY